MDATDLIKKKLLKKFSTTPLNDFHIRRMVGSCGTGTSAPTSVQDLKPGQVRIFWYFLDTLIISCIFFTHRKELYFVYGQWKNQSWAQDNSAATT